MPAKQHPLDVQSVGEDTYIVMSKGHHDLDQFMTAAIQRYPGWALGGPVHVWIKTTPGHGTSDCMYNMVPEGTRGCWPATYCHEYGGGYERYSGEVEHMSDFEITVTEMTADELPEYISALDQATRDWTDRAARGECGWVCASCCYTFNEGMPDQCCHGLRECTDIIKRDKMRAMRAGNEPS